MFILVDDFVEKFSKADTIEITFCKNKFQAKVLECYTNEYHEGILKYENLDRNMGEEIIYCNSKGKVLWGGYGDMFLNTIDNLEVLTTQS